MAGLLAVALLAPAYPAAASGDGPAPGAGAAQSGPKDYSRNSVTGEFAEPAAASPHLQELRRLAAGADIRSSSLAGTASPRTAGAGIRTSSLAGTISPRTAVEVQPAGGDSPWPELAIGFAGGCLVAGAAAVIAGRTRRARVAV